MADFNGPIPTDEELLEESRFTIDGAVYPYYVIQISSSKERPFKGRLVSDAIAKLIEENDFTHIIAQTHGWNTPPDKAIAVPFTEFIGGMQNDRAMPTGDDFRPLFVAFIWNALPIKACRTSDARTRAELLAISEREEEEGDNEVADVLESAVAAGDAGDEETVAALRGQLVGFAEHSGDTHAEETVRNVYEQEAALHEAPSSPKDEEGQGPLAFVSNFFKNVRATAGRIVSDYQSEMERINKLKAIEKSEGVEDGFGNIFITIMRPVEFLVFGRLQTRARKTGVVMGEVMGKLMSAAEGSRPRVCLMANSLGAHVLVSVVQQDLPWKVHTVFFVQGAIASEIFDREQELGKIHERVAGPVICTYSTHDGILRNIFSPFYGNPLGFVGVDQGLKLLMKGLSELEETPYSFECSCWNSIDGSEYIDEGSVVAGGHGDFKEDETTSLYWSAIKAEVDDDRYDPDW